MQSLEPMKILLVGIGGYGVNYVREFLGIADESLVVEGVCDPFAKVSPEYGAIRQRQIPVYDTLPEFYTSHHADLAVISSPIHLHCAQTLECLAHQSNVLCEKPLCTDSGQARRMLDAQNQSGRFVAVGYQLSYSRDVLALKRDILDGRFGQPLRMKALHAMRRGSVYYGRNGWAGKISRNGAAVYDSPLSNACAHQLHNMLFLLGNRLDRSVGVKKVQAQLYRANPTIENFDTVAVRFGTDADIDVYYYTSHAIEEKRLGPLSEYQFEKATVYFGLDGKADYVARFHDGSRVCYGEIPKGKRLQKLYDAIACTRTHTEPVCTIETAIPHVQCIEYVQKSAEENGIRVVRPDRLHVWKEGDETFTSLPGAEEKLRLCYERWALPREIGFELE